MNGVIYALTTALVWGGSITLLRFLSTRIDSLSLNVLRLSVAGSCLISFVSLSGRGAELLLTPLLPLVLVLASGIIEQSMGDTTYIRSLSYLEASRGHPIAAFTFRILTFLVAGLFLGEPFTWLTIAGMSFVLLGVYLVITGRTPWVKSTSQQVNMKGVLLALAAAVLWTVAATILKVGVRDMDPFVAAGVRVPSAAMALLLFTVSQRNKGSLQFQKYGARTIALAAVGGVLSYGIGAVLYVFAIQAIGVGKAVIISGLSPLFTVLFSVLFLKERLTWYILGGILLGFSGVVLVAM